jgi:FixJ family two-component response regulator
MPGMSGLELQRHLIVKGHRIPIISISANENQEIRNDALHAGAIGYISKPFSDEALLNAIGNALVSA